ncbi:MAG: gliding motility-associated C-terminal domain-containing protein [Saprospiraceae bacterium]|nr:gliding motility-associated C-terminal domain-containing protein [Saprospiraceae bacterium]
MEKKLTLRLILLSAISLLVANQRLYAQGCPGLSSVSVNVVAAPVPNISGPVGVCSGQNAVLSVGGGPFTSYNWSTGETTPSISVSTAGTYAVTVSNAAGCTGTDDFDFQVNPLPEAVISITGSNACGGQITLTSVSSFPTYAWSTGETTSSITVSTSGTYTLTVTDANGCTDDVGTTIFFETSLNVSISGDNQFCEGEGATLTAAPSGLGTYTWSNGQAGESITVTTPGTYGVTVSGASGCTGEAAFGVVQLPNPAPVITGPALICSNENANLAVNGSFSAYLWSTGETGPSINTSAPGAYTVTVTSGNGCTNTGSFTLSVNPAPNPQITAAPYLCNGQLVLNAGSGFTAYTWSTGQTGNPVTVTNSGNYLVTVTDANGCTNFASFFADVPPFPQVSITGDNQFCQNDNTSLFATPGFNGYVWSNGQSSQDITVSTPGTYSVTATDAFGCTDTDNFTVTQLPAPVPTIDGPGSFCELSSATLTVPGSFSAYAWSTGQNGSSISVNAPGNYTVTVTDNNGCTGTDTEPLNQLPAPQPAITAAPYLCNGVLTLDAGAGFSSYAWSTGQNGNPITVTTSGNYLVTVTGANGCTGADVFFADIPAAPVVAITGDNQFCEGSGGDIQATPGFNSYVWSTGQTGQGITVNNGGTYAVTATDGFGCTATDDFPVTEFPAPAPVVAGPASVCQGQTAVYAAQTGFGSYVWSTGETTPAITVSVAGAYTVTVTDLNGCTGTDDATLALLPAPQPAIQANPYACDGQVTLNAGSGFSVYAWSTGQNTPTILTTASDDYAVTVTGANGCTGTDVFTVDIPADPVVDITGSPTFCQGAGSLLTASAGLNAYVWSTGETTTSITVDQTGNYGVTATDGFGCTATDVFSVQAVNNPAPVITGPTSICAGGSAVFTVSGAFNNYSWSNGQNGPSITVSTPGTYSVTVTDTNGCVGTDDQSLTLSSTLTPVITAQPYACNGQITLDAGAGFATYDWSGGQNTQTVLVSVAGDYTVTVTDGTGCSGTDLISVTIPADPSVSVSGAPAICPNTTTVLDATPGFGSYAWSNGQVGASITVGAAGTYTVTATDNFGCTATGNFSLAVNPLPGAAVTGPAIICVNSSGTLSAPAGMSAYLWSNAETTPAIVVTGAGTYTVTVTDANGCTNIGNATVTVASQLDPQITAQPYDCDGQIAIDAGAGFATYTWSSGQNTQAISATSSGAYGVTVTDVNGCTGAASIAVTVPALPVVSVSGNTTFCAGAGTTLNATPGFVAYAWSTGGNTPSVSVGVGGPVTVTVTDAQGCTAIGATQLTAQPLPTPQISGPAAVCAGNSATLSVIGASGGIAWSTGANTPSISVSAPGLYSATVTDANGCTGTASANLVVNTNPAPQIQQAPYACDGQIGLGADPGFVAYQWNGGQVTAFISATQTGDYTVTVTDANGCTGSATVTVDVPALSQVSIGGDLQFCQGAGTSLSASAGFAGYVWSGGQTVASITVNQPGTYSVTATDALGCTSVALVDVLEIQSPQPAISGPLTVCPGTTATLTAPAGFVVYQWSTGALTPGITVQPPVTVALTVTDANGCTGAATASVGVSNQLTPVILSSAQACTGQVTLDAGNGFQQYIWSTGEVSAQITVAQPGTYSVTVSDGQGCSGEATIDVTPPAVPVVSVTGADRACPGQTVALEATPGFVSYLWSSGQTAPVVDALPGTYGVTVTDADGCTAQGAFTVEALPAPVPAISGPGLLCGGASVTLTATPGFAAYQWSNGGGGASVLVSQAGAYGVTVTDLNGCTGVAQAQVTAGTADTTFVQATTCNPLGVGTSVQTFTSAGGCDSVVITQTTLAGVFGAAIEIDSDFNGFGISCAGATDGFATGIPLGGQAPFQYQWSNGATTATAANIGAGAYTVTITDAVGCSGTASATLAQPEPVLPVVQALGPTCSTPGAITVQSVGGGGGPYTVRLFQDVGVTNGSQVLSFEDLEEGTFTVEVTDANGCTAEELVVLAPVEVINEFVGDTIEIFPGDTVTLNAAITITPVDISWTVPPSVDLSCDNCLNPTLAPVLTTTLQLYVQGYGDCSAEGRFVILVKTGKQVFIPNVIAPDSGNENARFTLYGDESVVNIRSLQIYDRWGGKMAVFQNILPNRPELGWDGTFQGDMMMPGVYVYWAEVAYADGTVEVFSGDLTLVR